MMPSARPRTSEGGRGGADRAVAAGDDDRVAALRRPRFLANALEVLRRDLDHVGRDSLRGEQGAQLFARAFA